MQVHVGAVEQRIALADHRDAAARIEMSGERGGAAVVEGRDPAAIGGLMPGNFGGHGIEQRDLGNAGPQMAGGDGARLARIAGLGEVRDHVGLAQRPQCLERHQFGVAGPDADADQPRGGAHSPGLASALTAAAVIALPPMRPRTMR